MQNNTEGLTMKYFYVIHISEELSNQQDEVIKEYVRKLI